MSQVRLCANRRRHFPYVSKGLVAVEITLVLELVEAIGGGQGEGPERGTRGVVRRERLAFVPLSHRLNSPSLCFMSSHIVPMLLAPSVRGMRTASSAPAER